MTELIDREHALVAFKAATDNNSQAYFERNLFEERPTGCSYSEIGRPP